MALLLGIDTGGTYTDAVLIDANTNTVLHTAKAPTTHQDLVQGVRQAMQAVLEAGNVLASTVGLVSVSTTLATNALVEGTGDPACLITLGFSTAQLEKAGVLQAMDGDTHVVLDGGHDAHGNELSAVDVAQATTAIQQAAEHCAGFAVAAQFSVRNPSHELALRDLISELTGHPVTCSHELSAALNGPRRALTALLNARLIGMIDDLAKAVRASMKSLDMVAPLMMVRGDGTLVSAEFAAHRPIETVLSGPAASVIGARYLAHMDDALVVDIGGTTTDVATVRNGVPNITDTGATVAGHKTMVHAVDMTTRGIGGDSEVRVDSRHPDGPLLLGPQRAVPMCRLASSHPELVHRFLDMDLNHTIGLGRHGRILVSFVSPDRQPVGLDERETQVLDALAEGPIPEHQACPTGLLMNAADRLKRRGLVRVATMTPTDAAHVLGVQSNHDQSAAQKISELMARQSTSSGAAVAASGEDFAHQVTNRVIRRSAELLLEASLAADGVAAGEGDRSGGALAVGALATAALNGHAGLTRLDIGLTAPLVALGAPAGSYYPQVADLLGTSVSVPQYAEVANAVGSVVGHVAIARSATITQPTKGQFRLHHDEQPTFGSVENARNHGLQLLGDLAMADAVLAGAADPELSHVWDATTATIEGKEVFVEGTLTVTASGRPRLA